MTKMNPNTVLRQHINSLVSDYAIFNGNNYELFFDNLSDTDQGDSVKYYLETIDRDINEAIYNDDFDINNDLTVNLLQILSSNSKEDKIKFAEVARENTIKYFKNDLQELITEACQEYQDNRYDEHGYTAHQAQDNGETIWCRY